MSKNEGESLAPQITRPELEQVVTALLDRRNAPEKLAPLLAPEAEWTMNGDKASWPYAGLRCRRDSILDYLTAFTVEFRQENICLISLLIDREQACAQYEMHLRHRGTGREGVLQALTFIRVEGDVVVEVHEFLDSALLFRLRESVGR